MGRIRERIREVGTDLGRGISEAKGFLKKRAEVMPKGKPAYAFSVVPQRYIEMPKVVKRKHRQKIRYVYVKKRR